MTKIAACVGLLLTLMGAPALTTAQDFSRNGTDNEDWVKPFPAFKIVGNVYWVGGYDLSTYLITTPAGHILINTGVGDTAKQIAASMTQLGFKITDVKILTATHAHLDHAAGLAELKRMSGAQVVVNERDKEVYETGGKSDFRFGDSPNMNYEPVVVDRTFKAGETLSLGGVAITTHSAAGHTKGATTFTLNVTDSGKTYRVAIANMPSINPGVKMTGMPGYPEVGDDYAKTFIALKDLRIDVFLASHASQFKLHEKYTPGAPYNPDRFVDPNGFRQSLSALEKTYLEQRDKDRKENRR
jgi:metallo-beta-lactamase class B